MSLVYFPVFMKSNANIFCHRSHLERFFFFTFDLDIKNDRLFFKTLFVFKQFGVDKQHNISKVKEKN